MSEKMLTTKEAVELSERWFTVHLDDPYDVARNLVVDHIVATQFIAVPSRNIRQYWLDYANKLYDLSDVRRLKIFWTDIVYLLVNYYYSSNLAPLVKEVMIENYLKKL